ncbi:MAG: SURF1 family protein [Janthinobacterium lividum]
MPEEFDEVRSKTFTPRSVGITALAFLAVALCVVLGIWQWNRGSVVISEPPAVQPVVDVTRVVTGAQHAEAALGVLSSDEVGRRVQVRGVFDPSVNLLVPGRAVGGTNGSWVLGVVQLADGSGMPFVRGWVARGEPAPAPPTGEVDLVGVVQPPENSDVAPSTAALPPGQVWVVSAADLVNRVAYPVANAYVTDTAPAAGLSAVAAQDSGRADHRLDWRNLAYAAQWWVFAGFALVVWVRVMRDEKRAEGGSTVHAEGPADENGGWPGEDRTPGGPDSAAGDGLGGRDMSGTR